MMDIELNGFKFISSFDSGNLGRVEFLREDEGVGEDKIYEFNIWTRPDCAGTEFANGNRTWFYFGVSEAPQPCYIMFNIIMNKQSKMYGQGMAPVYRVLPGQPNWERIKERPTFVNSDGNFFLNFSHRLSELNSPKKTIYFAFTYPFSYNDLEQFLDSLEFQLHPTTCCVEPTTYENIKEHSLDNIYFHREVLCHSIEGRNVNLITITSLHNITPVREVRLNHLFPEEIIPRPFKFNKKVIFLSARVHPGETPSSFVLNGIIKYLTASNDPHAMLLRKYYVFKIIPMLNPDGVYHGNYRTDTRGVNLNRVYNNPSIVYHPSVYGARAALLYHHYGREIVEVSTPSKGEPCSDSNKITRIEDGVSDLYLEKQGLLKKPSEISYKNNEQDDTCQMIFSSDVQCDKVPLYVPEQYDNDDMDSGIFLYIDMHGHASKKGIFMYGNHFKDVVNNVECRLFPKLVSLNSPHFHYDSCNFSERIMYTNSREGSGRVSVYKATGLIRSYTLECNYNTGKKLNQLPPLPTTFDKRTPTSAYISPPKYTPAIYEEAGRQLLISVLDLNNLNPMTRITQSQYRTLNSVREALRLRIISENNLALQRDKSRSAHKVCSPNTPNDVHIDHCIVS